MLSSLSKGHTKLKQLGDDSGEVSEEQCIVLGVFLGDGLEFLVLHQNHVGRKHHQALGFGILVLFDKRGQRRSAIEEH